MRAIHFLSAVFLISVSTSFAQPIYRAGVMSVKQRYSPGISGTVDLTFRSLTSGEHIPDVVTVCWGDGVCEEIQLYYRAPVANGIWQNEYRGSHTYPAGGRYMISVENCCMTDDSFSYSPSGREPFKLYTEFDLLSVLFFGINSTPEFLQYPIDAGYAKMPLAYNINAYDADGDSLSYALLPLPVKDYRFPNQVRPGPANRLTLDPITGSISWDTPPLAGNYHVLLETTEYRSGVRISRSSALLEFQIHRAPTSDSDEEELLVFPNPTEDFLSLRSRQGGELIESFELFDSAGRLILNRKFDDPRSFYYLQLSDLPNAVYLLKMRFAGEFFTHKVFKR
jgi:hypothetical protein